MATGELEFDDILYSENSEENPMFIFLTCITFVAFIVVINLSVMNLLVALAVKEMDEFMLQSELKNFENAVKLIKNGLALRIDQNTGSSRSAEKYYKDRWVWEDRKR